MAAERVTFLQEAVAASAALAAADRLGVLARLAAGPIDPSTLATECSIGERGSRLLVAALAGLGLVDRTADGRYRATSLDPERLASLRTPWEGLAEAIRSDRPAVAVDDRGAAEKLYPNAVGFLAELFAPVAARAADQLAGSGLRILDLGAGAAPWSLALATRDPACRVTAVDLPGVIPATRRAVADAGLDTRFEMRAGDLFTIDLGRDEYDLAIAGNVCHLFDGATNRRLLGRLGEAVRVGGRVAIMDAVPDERLEGPRGVVLYALGLLLRTRAGRVYPFSTYVEWLRAAGFEAIERFDLSAAPPLTLITARRRTAGAIR
ncbi:MAG: methyltransferase domain-containing protein [Chloroflexi bacterium]|nr:methyltransferase domain-containing protein [Chloroflexota bacterium]